MSDVKWTTTRIEQHVEDGSGYEFDIVATRDEELGWNAHVTIAAHGFKDAAGAVNHLKFALERLLSMLPMKHPTDSGRVK